MLQRQQPSERRNLKGSLYGFTPGGDLRPLWMILLAPQNHPSKKKLSALQRSSQARQGMRSIREEATAPGANTALTLQVKKENE